MIESYIQEKASLIDDQLDRIISDFTSAPTILLDSLKYSLLAGGKRLRPVLVLATIDSLGKDEKIGIPFACAIEMIHTFSLIHDDLPAMDDDDYRRGKLANHKVYGEAMAILTGDTLLTEAFGMMVSGVKEANLSQASSLDILEEAVIYTGARGMVAGQVDDILSANDQVTLKALQEIHQRKTGNLIAFAIRTGAKLGEARPETVQALTDFAYHLGLAFQIQDDILDVVGNPVLIGKPVGSDEEQQKATYPSLIGLDRSKEMLSQSIYLAKQSIMNLPDLNPERLLAIADYLLDRKR